MSMLKENETVVCRGFADTCKTKCVDLEGDELYKYCLSHCKRHPGWIEKKPFDPKEWERKTLENVEKNREIKRGNMNHPIFSPQRMDKLKEISERYKQLFIREFINTSDPDDKIRYLRIRDLTKFVAAGAEAVLNSYLREMRLDNRYSSHVTISANMYTREIRFNVRIYGIYSELGRSIEILTGIANQCAGE